MQQLKILQSLWTFEGLLSGPTPNLEKNLDTIAAAGFDGIGALWIDREESRRVAEAAKARNLIIEGLAVPSDIESLKPSLDWGAEFGVYQINIQPDVRPRKLSDAVKVLEGWQRLAEQVDFAV